MAKKTRKGLCCTHLPHRPNVYLDQPSSPFQDPQPCELPQCAKHRSRHVVIGTMLLEVSKSHLWPKPQSLPKVNNFPGGNYIQIFARLTAQQKANNLWDFQQQSLCIFWIVNNSFLSSLWAFCIKPSKKHAYQYGHVPLNSAYRFICQFAKSGAFSQDNTPPWRTETLQLETSYKVGIFDKDVKSLWLVQFSTCELFIGDASSNIHIFRFQTCCTAQMLSFNIWCDTTNTHFKPIL